MIFDIIKYPNEILNTKCKTIKKNTYELQELISDMFDTLKKTGGVGLAAPQVGFNIRLFIVDNIFLYKKRVFINPILELVNGNNTMNLDLEGCLSIPNKKFKVDRFVKIKATYLNENFEEKSEIFKDFYARVLQHEYDHLRGITLMDLKI